MLALALAACGGSDGGKSPEEGAVRAAVTEAYLSPDPGVCGKRYTEQVLQQLGGAEVCRSLRTETQPDRIGKLEIESVDLKGERAIVRVRSKLGHERLVLVNSESVWKIEQGQKIS